MKCDILPSMKRLIILAFLILARLAHGQDDGLEVRFLAERAPKELGEVVMAAGEKTSQPFVLPVNNLSEALPAPGRKFSLRVAGHDKPLAEVALPGSAKSFIVLLIPSRAGGYSSVVIAADDPKFQPGDVYFYNHGDKPVLGYVGTAKFILQPGTGRTLTPAGARAEGFYDVGFGVREESGDRALSTTRWPVEERIRSYVFFFVNPETRRIDFRAVDEFVPPENEGA